MEMMCHVLPVAYLDPSSYFSATRSTLVTSSLHGAFNAAQLPRNGSEPQREHRKWNFLNWACPISQHLSGIAKISQHSNPTQISPVSNLSFHKIKWDSPKSTRYTGWSYQLPYARCTNVLTTLSTADTLAPLSSSSSTHFYVSHLGSLYKGCFAILWVQIKRFARLISLVFKVT